MELASGLLTALAGILISLVVSLLTKFISDRTFIQKSKIKIGGVEVQFSESVDESTRKILDTVQELQESPQVFLSYSIQDKKFAQLLTTDLRKEGIKVWLADEQVRVGDNITDTIRDGITSSLWIIIILSKNSLQSDFIKEELSYAIQEEHKRNRPFILPALIDDSILPTQLQDKQYADFREEYYPALERLLYRIKPSNRMSRGRLAEAQQWYSWYKWINKGDNTGWQELKTYGELVPTVREAIIVEIERLMKKYHENKLSDGENLHLQQMRELINLDGG